MSEKQTRLSNGDKMAILEAIKIPGFQKGGHYEPNKLDIGFRAGFFCALFRKLRSQINSKIFLKTQHFGGMTKIFCYFSWVLLRKA